MRKNTLISVSISVAIAVLAAGVAISAQDKYTVKVPDGLAFSEFRGYESWPVIAISESEGKIAVIVGNPVMIDAYKEGVPGNGRPFPDGAKMAKIHWIPKKQETYPGQPTVPGTQHDYDKASKIAHYAMDNDLTLKAAALKLGFVTEELFNRVVDPAKMVRPYVAGGE
jgi:hypothetical protein